MNANADLSSKRKRLLTARIDYVTKKIMEKGLNFFLKLFIIIIIHSFVIGLKLDQRWLYPNNSFSRLKVSKNRKRIMIFEANKLTSQHFSRARKPPKVKTQS